LSAAMFLSFALPAVGLTWQQWFIDISHEQTRARHEQNK